MGRTIRQVLNIYYTILSFFSNLFLTFAINCLKAGFKTLFRKGAATVADIVATTVMANVVDTVFNEGKYFSTFVVGEYKTLPLQK